MRLELMLEDASIKLSIVASSLTTVSARAMLAALIAGERDPRALARWPRAGCGSRSPRWPRR
jgi:transposase